MSPEGLAAFAQLQRAALESMPHGDVKNQLGRELAPRQQTTQHAIGAVLAFVLSFTLAFYLANRTL
jgi:hypothetical protein